MQEVHKKFDNNLSLEEESALSVKKDVEDFWSPKDCENCPLSEEIGGRRLRNMGASALEGFPRENKDLHRVLESGVDPSDWCLEGHVAEIHRIQRKDPSKKIKQGENPKS